MEKEVKILEIRISRKRSNPSCTTGRISIPEYGFKAHTLEDRVSRFLSPTCVPRFNGCLEKGTYELKTMFSGINPYALRLKRVMEPLFGGFATCKDVTPKQIRVGILDSDYTLKADNAPFESLEAIVKRHYQKHVGTAAYRLTIGEEDMEYSLQTYEEYMQGLGMSDDLEDEDLDFLGEEEDEDGTL